MSEQSITERYPTVPTDALEAGGWSHRHSSVDVRARVAGFTIRAHERRYEDANLREQVQVAGGPDHLWRLFFATRLTFTPPLPPGVGAMMASPQVRSAAHENFKSQLREEGLTDVTERGEEQLRIDGTRARTVRYDAALHVETADGERTIPMEAWLAIWRDGAFLLAGGLHPREPLGEVLQLDTQLYDPDAGREELPALIRQVER